MATITLIAAVSQNRVIGTAAGTMPWAFLPADMRRFRRLTAGKPVLMGRATFDSIGCPLPGRRNIVITRQPAWAHDGVETASSVEAALLLAGDVPVMVVGGGTIYAQTIALADRLEITWVSKQATGSVLFPLIDQRIWRCIESSDQDGFTFASYARHAA